MAVCFSVHSQLPLLESWKPRRRLW